MQYLLVQVKAYFGCAKAVFVPVDAKLQQMLANEVQRDPRLQKFVHTLDFVDRHTRELTKLLAVANDELDTITELVAPSLHVNNTYPDLTVTESKMAMIFRKSHPQNNGEVTFLIQVEHHQNKDKGSKSPSKKKKDQTQKRFSRIECIAF